MIKSSRKIISVKVGVEVKIMKVIVRMIVMCVI